MPKYSFEIEEEIKSCNDCTLLKENLITYSCSITQLFYKTKSECYEKCPLTEIKENIKDEYKTALVENFISQVKQKYPNIYISYDYVQDEDEYEIWHSDSSFNNKDIDFAKFVGELMKKIFIVNKFYNFSFGYDYFKSEKLESEENK